MGKHTLMRAKKARNPRLVWAFLKREASRLPNRADIYVDIIARSLHIGVTPNSRGRGVDFLDAVYFDVEPVGHTDIIHDGHVIDDEPLADWEIEILQSQDD